LAFVTAPELLLLGLGGLGLAALTWVLAALFRSGSRARFVTWRPFITYAALVFGILLVRWTLDWLTDDPERAPFVFTLAMGGILSGIASAVWFSGFLFGHWRRERRAGILTGRR